MDLLTWLCIVSITITGLTSGAGVLPNGPLNATVGGRVVFTTTLTAPEKPLLAIAWKFGNKPIITSNIGIFPEPEYNDRTTLYTSTGSLELRNVTHNDSGEYSVSITPNGGRPQEGSTILQVYERVANVVVTANTTDVVEFSSSVRLSCSTSGTSPSFLWLNSSFVVTPSDRVQLTNGGSALTIVNVTRYDQGPFRCHAFNPVSNGTSKPVTLSIRYGPENVSLTIFPLQEYYVEGSNIHLFCSAVSNPAALFEWLLNGDKLDTGPELSLSNIQMSQSGNYSCQALNNKTLSRQTSQPSVVSVLALPENTSSCSAGCVAGIVIACFAVLGAGAGGGYYIYNKNRKQSCNRDATSRTGNEDQDNAAQSGSQELSYADVSHFVNKAGGRVQLRLDNNSTEYAQVIMNNSAPAASSPPTYDAHMQQKKRPAPQPRATGL